MTDANSGGADVEIVELEAQNAVAVKTKATPATVGRAFGVAMGELGQYVHGKGLQMVGPPFARYLTWGDEFELEVGMPVASPDSGEGNVVSVELPAGRAARALHLGPYEGLSQTYGRIQEWMKEQGIEPAGPPWDSYITDPSQVKDPKDYRTEVYWPIG